MTRVLSYNILLGGADRVEPLRKMIASVQPDIVGLVEATNADVVQQLAADLGMQLRITGAGLRKRDWHIAVLSRLPIIQSRIHTRPLVLTRRHLLEVQVEGTDGKPLTLFVIHLAARAQRGRQSVYIRRAEVRELLNVMQRASATPHLAMGDFNSLVPGDTFDANRLVRYALADIAGKKKVQQSFSQRSLMKTAQAAVHTRGGSFLVDTFAPAYIQGGNDILLQAGYIDCYRQLHPHAPGYTFPAANPATRIDYIFASPELAPTLAACDVIVNGNDGVHGKEASDHLPIWADFANV